MLLVGKQTHDLTVTASDSKTTQSGGDNRKKFPLGAALQVPQNFSFAPFILECTIRNTFLTNINLGRLSDIVSHCKKYIYILYDHGI
jgi:hypothetical protein